MAKKMWAALGMAAALTVAASMAASAAAPTYTYECAKLTKQVTVDGKVAAGEWDDANELVVNADNAVLEEHGLWQGGDPRTTEQLSVTYRLKWDENNLYILEQRTDKEYTGAATAKEPWTCDGTLLFLAVDKGGTVTNTGRFDAFWVTQATDNTAKTAMRTYKTGAAVVGDSSADWKFAGAKEGDVYTMELAIPWKDIQANMTDSFEVKAGQAFRFTPIVPDYLDGEFTQMDFYVGEANPDDPDQWGGLKLVAADGSGSEGGDEGDSGADNPKTGEDSQMLLFCIGGLMTAAMAVLLLSVKQRRAAQK